MLKSLILTCPYTGMSVIRKRDEMPGRVTKISSGPFSGECKIQIKWESGDTVELYHFETSDNYPILFEENK